MKTFSTPGTNVVSITFALALFAWGTPDLHAQDPGQPPAGQQQEIAANSVEGAVVQAEGSALTVRTEEGETLTFRIEAETRLTDALGQPLSPEERQAKLDDLDEGDRLVVEYEPGPTPEEFVATSIQLRPAEPAPPADN